MNGHKTRRPGFPTGNRLEHPQAAPHGVYPSLGDDRWVAIAVFDDDDWQRLVEALGSPDWAADPRFDTQAGRFALQDELDKHLSDWTEDPHAARGDAPPAGRRRVLPVPCRTPRTSTRPTRRSRTAAPSSSSTTP